MDDLGLPRRPRRQARHARRPGTARRPGRHRHRHAPRACRSRLTTRSASTRARSGPPRTGWSSCAQHCRLADPSHPVRAQPLPRLAGAGAVLQGRRADLAAGPRRGPASARRRLRPAAVPPRGARPRVARPRPAAGRARAAVRVVLASASPARLATLRAAGIEPSRHRLRRRRGCRRRACRPPSSPLQLAEAKARRWPRVPAARGAASCWAATPCSSSTARRSASPTTPPRPPRAGGRCAAASGVLHTGHCVIGHRPRPGRVGGRVDRRPLRRPLRRRDRRVRRHRGTARTWPARSRSTASAARS